MAGFEPFIEDHTRLVGQSEIEALHVIVYSRSIGPDDHAGDVDVGLMATDKTRTRPPDHAIGGTRE